MDLTTVVKAISKLDTWLESMRQKGGYGGPVAHWWQHCLLYTGPGIDWRYEGVLAGYHLLYEKTGQSVFKQKLVVAVQDVINAQREDGSFYSSQFEMNPGTLGTPHEAAATLGLLIAFRSLKDEQIVTVARDNLNHLIAELWDESGKGFNDKPGIRGRVPNKLATLSEALIEFYHVSGEERYLHYARNALDTVLSYQVSSGAVHQYAHDAGDGDNKFFPFYNARCVPPLVRAGLVLQDARYLHAGDGIIQFLSSTMNQDGSWDQIVYPQGRRAYSPRWIAGAADILRAYQQAGVEVPLPALSRVLNAQLESGAFPTAVGFANRFRPYRTSELPTFHDVLPVVGWNDKIFRFLVEQLPVGNITIPTTSFNSTRSKIADGVYSETWDRIQMVTKLGGTSFDWNKQDPWSRRALEAFA